MTRQDLVKANEYLKLSEVYFKAANQIYNYGLSAPQEYLNYAKGVISAEEAKQIRNILVDAAEREAKKYQQKFDEL